MQIWCVVLVTPVPTQTLRPRCLLSSFIHRNCLLRIVAGRPIRILQIVTPPTVGKQPTWPVHWRPVSKPPPRYPSNEQSQAGETRKYCQITTLDVKAYDLHYCMGSIEARIQCISMIPNLPIRWWHRIPWYIDTIRKPLFLAVAVEVSGVDWSPSLALRNQNNAISYRHIESISVLKF